ncbi:hypothetical protein B9G98_00409 [Wickerhamiella sorbophila]|uniref:Multifunctional methyltransferase subunit trm112 n=1 Tax=Wickerhamiella sorbophila TaxID=45607 RepID=A0A2T0FCX4_9ASCO|nr:hypothetical protein B9G98_00409 [Wickerhamiella sorbophila]PRT52789.1 hypothetical protein B9G98_00409 [Wickerhamiella sorbophila]
MKFLTTNFVQCAVQSCARSSDAFPLKYSECQLVQKEIDFDPEFIAHMLQKLDWDALVEVAAELGNSSLPPQKPTIEDAQAAENEQLLRDLHSLLLETQIEQGVMTCKNCGHLYHIKNFIPNFLLPPHLA